MKSLIKLLAVVLATGLASASRAQDFQATKPIRVVLPGAPGTGSDVVMRLITSKLKDSTGWTFVLDNRPGANGTLALGEVARTKPDGHEWVVGLATSVTLAPQIMKLSFDPAADLVPVAYVLDSPMLVI